jgi:hypothetical protein
MDIHQITKNEKENLPKNGEVTKMEIDPNMNNTNLEKSPMTEETNKVQD